MARSALRKPAMYRGDPVGAYDQFGGRQQGRCNDLDTPNDSRLLQEPGVRCWRTPTGEISYHVASVDVGPEIESMDESRTFSPGDANVVLLEQDNRGMFLGEISLGGDQQVRVAALDPLRRREVAFLAHQIEEMCAPPSYLTAMSAARGDADAINARSAA